MICRCCIRLSLQCAPRAFHLLCAHTILFCVLQCPFRYGDQTHSHTPWLLFLGNVKAMYTSPLKRIRPHSFHLLLPLYLFQSLSLLYCCLTTSLTVRLLFVSFSAWCLQVPLQHDDDSESPSEVCLAIGSKVCWFCLSFFFFHHSLIFLFSNCNALCDLSGENVDRKTSALNSNLSGMAYSKNVFKNMFTYCIYVLSNQKLLLLLLSAAINVLIKVLSHSLTYIVKKKKKVIFMLFFTVYIILTQEIRHFLSYNFCLLL